MLVWHEFWLRWFEDISLMFARTATDEDFTKLDNIVKQRRERKLK